VTHDFMVGNLTN